MSFNTAPLVIKFKPQLEGKETDPQFCTYLPFSNAMVYMAFMLKCHGILPYMHVHIFPLPTDHKESQCYLEESIKVSFKGPVDHCLSRAQLQCNKAGVFLNHKLGHLQMALLNCQHEGGYVRMISGSCISSTVAMQRRRVYMIKVQ